MTQRRILLFGRTGSGKSTIANLLARGHLDAPLLFKTSSGVRGETLGIQREVCQDMVIVDTVGLGESELGSVSHEEAQKILYNFFTKVEEGFHCVAFVRKWNRNDVLDEQLWKFFQLAFKGAEENFVVIFTHFNKSPEELEVAETKELLLKMYSPCQRWICVDFPDQVRQGQKVISEAKRRLSDRSRTNSLALLKEKLAEFWRPALAPAVCLQLRLGRILLLGRRAAAKSILANLLVKGDFLNCPAHDLPFPMSPSGWSSAATGREPFKEGKGRRWEVVDLAAFESHMEVQFYASNCKELARGLADNIVTTLMQEAGFSHILFVHESGHGHRQYDKFVDNIWWCVILELISGAMAQNNRLVLVIADDSSGQKLSKTAMAEKMTWFKDCQSILHLEIPSLCDDTAVPASDRQLESINVGERLDFSRRILEQALLKEVDTQSTLFKLGNLPHKDKQQLITEISDAYLTPVVKATMKQGIKKHQTIFTASNPALKELSSVYRCIVNKSNESVMITVPVRHMWKEEQGTAVATVAAKISSATSVTEAAKISSAPSATMKNSDFCEVRKLVAGFYLDFCYLEMVCREGSPPHLIKITVESHDQGWSDFPEDQGTYRNSWTWGELAVLAPDRHTQIGERLRVYVNLHAVDDWQIHHETITEPSFLQKVQAHHIIALFVRSKFPGWSNHTRYASMQLVY